VQHQDGADRVDVSVLVPVRNERSDIEEVLASMRAQQFDGSVEFLLVDGRSEDGTRDILDAVAAMDDRVRVLDNPGRTTPSALNVGLRAARGEFIARMDAHSYYPPVYVAKGVDRLRRGDVEWVSGPALPVGRGRVARLVSLALASRLGAGASRKWGGAAETEMDTGVFAGVWRRSTLERHGGWNEGWPANQDSELAARVLGEGGRIVCVPELAARYVPRNTISGLARQYFRYGYYRAKTARRHSNSMRPSHLLPPGLVLAGVAALLAPRRLRRLSRAALTAYGAAMAVESVRVAKPERASPSGLAVVFATMHSAFGVGFLSGCARFGAPLKALVHLVKRG
jgi:succinoglycan biosynthesis protein ExoA